MKFFFLNHKNNALAFFLTAVTLLLFNFIFEISFHGDSKSFHSEQSAYYINKNFSRAMSNLGIKSDWLIKQKMSPENNDSLKYSYFVKVPSDLPIPVILNEINICINNGLAADSKSGEVKLESEEKIINGKTLLKAYSGDELKLSALLNYDDAVKRKLVEVGLLIEGLQNLSVKEDSVILGIPEDFAAVIIPEKNSPAFIKEIQGCEKQFALLLNDNISFLDYKLDPDYSRDRLILSIKNIAGTFYNAICFFFDTNSELYKSSSYHYIYNEFNKRKITLLIINSIKNISQNNENQTGEFDSFLENLTDGSKKLVLIPAGDFGDLKKIITKYRKLGYKFISPSLIISQDITNTK